MSSASEKVTMGGPVFIIIIWTVFIILASLLPRLLGHREDISRGALLLSLHTGNIATFFLCVLMSRIL